MPMMITLICPTMSVIGPLNTRKGREVTIPDNIKSDDDEIREQITNL